MKKSFNGKIFLAVITALALTISFVRAQSCASPPTNLVSWWSAEGTPADQVGGNNGIMEGNARFGTGEVGQGFVFTGNTGDGVDVGNPTNLQLQNFTIEGWIQRGSTSTVSFGSFGNALLFGYGAHGYGFYLDASGRLALSQVQDTSLTLTSPVITNLSFHHVAVTKSNATVLFYIDGVAYSAGSYNATFTFNTHAAIGARGDDLDNSFIGTIDELAIYSRALSLNEIQSIYQAGQAGKCISGPPAIFTPLADQTLTQSSSVTLAIAVDGTPPFGFQWAFNGTNLPGETNFLLSLPYLQPPESGQYTVTVTNLFGTANSSENLTVNPTPVCFPPTASIVSWWAAEGNAVDQISTNNGTLTGNPIFSPGEVGQGFVFNGTSQGVLLGNPANLQLQNLTIEAWIQRADPNIVSHSSDGNSLLFSYGSGGYGFFLDAFGRLAFGRMTDNLFTLPSPNITDTNFHHVAVTKSGTNLNFYIDGVQYPGAPLNTVFSFNTPAAIGARGDSLTETFLGTIDELAVYSDALAPSDIQSIFSAGPGGKCQPATPPYIIAQSPSNESAYMGTSVTLSVLAGGALPLRYQWQMNNTNLPGETDTNLVLTDLQVGNTGLYGVLVSNAYGVTNITPIGLSVLPVPPCAPPAAGMVSWWVAEGSASDQVSGNNGTLANTPAYASGEVGQAFSFNGSSQAVKVGNPANLQLQNFTIEAWIMRASTNIVSHGTDGNAFLFAYGSGGYGFGIDFSNRLVLSQVGGASLILSNVSIADTSFHHVAVTKSASNVFFYIDGAAYSNGTFSPAFTFTTAAAIGARGDTLNNSFLGSIDEMAIYDRALSAGEIQAIHNAAISGKCNLPVAPTIEQQPQGLNTNPNANVTLAVVAAGSVPLSYQWRLNNNNLAGATNSSLSLNNIQPTNSGIYSILITNAGGALPSSNAMVSVNIVTAFGNGQQLTASQYLFNGPVNVSLQSFYPNGDIFYTLDGSTPTAGSTLYTGPFTLTQSATLRTLGYSPDFLISALSGPVNLLVVPFYTLTTVNSLEGSISTSPVNTSPYPMNAAVTITAIPSNGWIFLQWQGDAAGINTSNTVVMTRNKSVQAIFGTAVSSTTSGGGSLVFNPAGGVYPYGGSLQATAIPQAGNVFVLWGSAAAGNTNPLTFLVTNANPTISALFTSLGSGQEALTVVPVGHGTVSVNPRANSYSLNSQVTITAAASSGKNFIGWTGDANGTNNPLTISMTASKTIFANFSTNNSLTGQFGPGGIADGFTVDLNGEFGLHYRLDGSSNLVDWVPLFTETNAVGTIHFIDGSATNSSQHFYRSVILP